jgi:hypothetical protein
MAQAMNELLEVLITPPDGNSYRATGSLADLQEMLAKNYQPGSWIQKIRQDGTPGTVFQLNLSGQNLFILEMRVGATQRKFSRILWLP